MAEIDWGMLANPVDVGAQVQQGFATGAAMVKQVQTKNALRAYLANPDDPQAYNALAAFDPGAAQSVQEQRLLQLKLNKEAEDETLTRAVGTAAANGNISGAKTAAISAGNFDLAAHLEALDKDRRDKLGAFYKAAGPLAYQMRQMSDPAQRQAFLQQNRDILEATGVDPKVIDGFDVSNNQALDGLIAANQTVDQLIGQNKIEWHQQGENPSFATNAMGVPVGSANPATVAQAPRVTDQKSYDAVPPGSHYLDPDGHLRVKGGQSGGSSTGGFQ